MGKKEDEERRTAVVGRRHRGHLRPYRQGGRGGAKIPRWCDSSLQPHVLFKETKNKQLPEKATINLAAVKEGKWATQEFIHWESFLECRP
ncbi:hypothetical protein C4D60_Mb04t38640 [Musa balbisiana]|uniref:Uncharacterized protein n=1 Tax=Musa balbisiana TaxID=52838 RepID=A0A4S8KHR4_MUSBA|nr:hypothetical protein C4D60_Mb04t38640 [Musa balbisiana]